MHGAKPVDQFRMPALLPASGPSRIEGTMMMSVASIVATPRCTLTGTRLASSSDPDCSPTISTRNGGGCDDASRGSIMEKAFITSKMPESVDTTASGMARMLTAPIRSGRRETALKTPVRCNEEDDGNAQASRRGRRVTVILCYITRSRGANGPIVDSPALPRASGTCDLQRLGGSRFDVGRRGKGGAGLPNRQGHCLGRP